MIQIDNRTEYQTALEIGFNPLMQWRYFEMNIRLRVVIQEELFGSISFVKENELFYRYMWNNSINVCEETGIELYEYSASYISHIISKGSDRRMATDPRNVNILCLNKHNRWEFGDIKVRKGMNIYPQNKIVIDLLKRDYAKL
jgi:hypothetical protein